MLDTVASFVPTALALVLLAFGQSTRIDGRKLLLVLAVAVGIGPLAEAVLGFGGWLVMIAIGVALLTTYAALRHEPQPRPRRRPTG